MYDSIYTHRERTVANHSVGEAFESAKRRLKEKNFFGPYCCDAINGMTLDQKITLKELNELAEQIVDDSLWYEG